MRARFALPLVAAALVATTLAPRGAFAHGIWGHIHVTGWAIENLPPGELRDFFDDPDVMNAALFGAAFTDSGYWPQAGELAANARAYGEHTHWEPYVQDFVEWIVENDPPPWDSKESRMRVAFLMGTACHGLQDEVFDSVFLFQVGEHDASGQDEADPASDGFLSLDGHLRFVPETWIPMDALLEIYADLDADITEDTIQRAVDLMMALYVNPGGAEGISTAGTASLESLPWTYDHLMDPDIPSSLRSEIVPTMRYIEAIWQRVHSDFDVDDIVIHTWPDAPRRLLGGDPESPDSWITLVFGMGVDIDTVQTALVDDEEVPVAVGQQGTRWGARYPRLVRIQPQAPLEPGAWYRAQLAAGALTIDGREVDASFEHRFQVNCMDDVPEICPDIDPFVAEIDGPHGEDAGGSDAGGTDAGGTDAGGTDAGAADAGGSDAGGSDTDGPGDTGATADASPDSDPGGVTSGSGGGGCAAAGTPSGGPLALPLLALVGLVRRRFS